MLQSLINYLFSASKWNKLRLLVKEKLLSLSYLGGRLAGIGARDVAGCMDDVRELDSGINKRRAFADKGNNTSAGADKATVELSHALAEHDQLPLSTRTFAWQFEATVPLDPEVFARKSVQYSQDAFLDTGHLQTHFDYQLADVPMASLCSNGVTHVSVFDAQDRYLPQYSYVKYQRGGNSASIKTRHLAISEVYSGVTLNLFGTVENVAGNYAHWIVDGVGLLYLALQHYTLQQIDYFLVPTLKYDFQRDVLLAIGVPRQKIIEIPPLACWRFERLLCATAPRGVSSGNTPGWLIDGYRASLLPGSASPGGRRLYISRRDAGSRKFINEEQIISMLARYDFESVEMSQYDFAQKIALFAQADVIVGLTGAGLTNMMFCKPSAQIIELFPASYVTYIYASMAGHLGLDHRALIFENDSVLSDMNKYYGNLSLDVSLLERHVAALDEPPRAY